ncbi:hypothetical protein KQX54_017609 [Cotesia glomerata]|uniref:Uncharacterized protein n=1 Tax=Cotesia glomerata TaxID=32391 RepID=A0AAV7HY47_COTGL|nr:hypothetical protein KQX54_017609 [Cotesia glomerata]
MTSLSEPHGLDLIGSPFSNSKHASRVVRQRGSDSVVRRLGRAKAGTHVLRLFDHLLASRVVHRCPIVLTHTDHGPSKTPVKE